MELVVLYVLIMQTNVLNVKKDSIWKELNVNLVFPPVSNVYPLHYVWNVDME